MISVFAWKAAYERQRLGEDPGLLRGGHVDGGHGGRGQCDGAGTRSARPGRDVARSPRPVRCEDNAKPVAAGRVHPVLPPTLRNPTMTTDGTAPTYQRLNVTLDGHVAVIELARPGKANALDLAMWHELRDAMRWLDATPNARVGILRGAGALFTSGIDLALLAGLPRADRRSLRRRARAKSCAGSSSTSRTRSRRSTAAASPCIAAIHGAVHRRRRRHRARLRHALLLRRRRVLGEGGRRRADRRSRHAAAPAAADRRGHGARARLYRPQRRTDAKRARSGSSTAATTRRPSSPPASASSPRRSRPSRRSPCAAARR